MWFAYSMAWLSTAIASIAGLYFTHSPWCLWVFIFPAYIGISETKDGKEKSEEESEELDNEKQ